MPDEKRKGRKGVQPDPASGTTSEADFGKTDRYANKDEEPFNFQTTGDGNEWDSGRNSSISRGSALENDVRKGDAETPGVKTRPAGTDRGPKDDDTPV
jgi:hypothetical protein